ncbi:glutathione S-transferase [Mycena latifolia]|nr:glutathione S-transferase [Mycena latifolia]
MVLKFYGASNIGGGGGIVAMVLAEKQIPFEYIVVDLATRAQKTPEFVAKHPFGLIPVIDDDGFILYESRAICRYLAEKYADQGTPLLPTTLQDKALFEQAASIEFANISPPLSQIVDEVFAKPYRGLPTDEAVIAQALSGLSTKLDVYEVILGKQKFLAGNEFTLADLFHLYYVRVLTFRNIDIMTSKGPNLARWWNDLVGRPAWVKLNKEGIKSTIN